VNTNHSQSVPQLCYLFFYITSLHRLGRWSKEIDGLRHPPIGSSEIRIIYINAHFHSTDLQTPIRHHLSMSFADDKFLPSGAYAIINFEYNRSIAFSEQEECLSTSGDDYEVRIPTRPIEDSA
jgi:hypothetical protein